MDKDFLTLKRASASRPSGAWGEDDYDVLIDGMVVGRIVKAAASPVASPGCGHCSSATTKTAHPRTAMSRRARPRWGHSLRVGGPNDHLRRLQESIGLNSSLLERTSSLVAYKGGSNAEVMALHSSHCPRA